MTTSITSHDLYQRQITLIGEVAFEKVREAKVLVIGAGGLGCPALQYLATSGIGTIGIVDFDAVSISNLQRQILFQVNDIGSKKVVVAKDKLEQLAPFCDVKIYPTFLNEANAEELISVFDIVLDCTDNFSAKFLIHDTCVKTKKVLVQASVYQYEGQLQVFDFKNQAGPCLRCLWPDEPQDGCVGTCADVGVAGPLLGVLGSIQAMEALKVIIEKPHLKNGETLFVDLLDLSFETRRFTQMNDCPCCVRGEFAQKRNFQIQLPVDLERFIVLDVRSQIESESCPFIQKLKPSQVLFNIPLENMSDFSPLQDQKYLTICNKGIRSLSASKILASEHSQIYSLAGGIENLSI
jgi:molybdopterin/thiamine biosynthesis adenylyltransferase/rhodanese-related sulfurtransferase